MDIPAILFGAVIAVIVGWAVYNLVDAERKPK